MKTQINSTGYIGTTIMKTLKKLPNLNLNKAYWPSNAHMLYMIYYITTIIIINRTSLAEKSARKDEKTLFWPPPILLVWLPNQRETKHKITHNQTVDDIRIVKQQV